MTEQEIYDELYKYIDKWAEREKESDNFAHQEYQDGFVSGMRYMSQYIFGLAQDIGKGYKPDRCYGGTIEPSQITAYRKQSYLNQHRWVGLGDTIIPCPTCGR